MFIMIKKHHLQNNSKYSSIEINMAYIKLVYSIKDGNYKEWKNQRI